MRPAHEVLDDALAQAEAARKRVARGSSKQVSGAEERDNLKAVALTCFKSHRPIVMGEAPHLELQQIDRHFQRVLDATAKSASRATYIATLKNATAALASLRSASLVPPTGVTAQADDDPPDFSSLAADPDMRSILEQRWWECQRCIRADASLAATVMMGGLLEALFVARANTLADKKALFTAKATPKVKATGKVLPLPEWTLRPYIDVGSELGWISRSGKDVAAVLRDYRNYIHPEKQRSHGVSLSVQDARMFWDVTKHLAGQLLAT